MPAKKYIMKEITTLNRAEVLLYLGHRGSPLTPSMESLIDECIDETLRLMTPRMVIKRYGLVKPENGSVEGILLSGTNIRLTGHSIAKHLAFCEEAFIMTTTAGLEIEKNIRKNMIVSPAKGVILDSCGSVAVEAVTQAAEDEAAELAKKDGLNITWRFGPGYGDLPLDLQKDITDELAASVTIGVGVNTDLLLSPYKSETAIIGIMKQEKGKRGASCEVCRFKESCNIKAHGARCH